MLRAPYENAEYQAYYPEEIKQQLGEALPDFDVSIVVGYGVDDEFTVYVSRSSRRET